MAQPTNREEFISWCLRKLGAPVINIDVAQEQVEDRVDEALSFYWDYHFDGSDKIYYKHQVTEADIKNKYIRLPENIIGAVSVFPPNGQSVSGPADMFNITYQIMLNDIWTMTSESLVPYYMTREKLATMQEILVGQVPIRYNRHRNLLHLDMNWSKVRPGQFLLVEAYEIVDPEVFEDVWKDRWLQNYATALIKVQWGSNLTKFIGQQLVGGVQFNGERILDDGVRERDDLEDKMKTDYSLPPLDMVG